MGTCHNTFVVKVMALGLAATPFAAASAADESVVIDGLEWSLTTNGSDVRWPEAVDYCAELERAGRDHWRLPTMDELKYTKRDVERKKNLFNFVLNDDLEKVKSFCETETMSQTDHKSLEFRFIGRKGNVKHVMSLLSHIPGTNMCVASLLEITEFKQREREAIASVTTALRSAQTRADMLPIVIDQLMELMKADGASLAMRDLASGETVIEISKGDWVNWVGVRLRPGVGISGHVLTTWKPYVNNEVLSNTRFARPDLIGDLKAVACVPLITQGFGNRMIMIPIENRQPIQALFFLYKTRKDQAGAQG